VKVKQIATGETKTVNAAYGARLIESGQAVLVHETAKPAPKSEKPAESKRTSAEKAAKFKDE